MNTNTMQRSLILKEARIKVGDKRYFGEDGVLEAFRQVGILAQAAYFKQINGEPTEDFEAHRSAIESRFPEIDFNEWCGLSRKQFINDIENGHFTDEWSEELFLKGCLATFGLEL